MSWNCGCERARNSNVLAHPGSFTYCPYCGVRRAKTPEIDNRLAKVLKRHKALIANGQPRIGAVFTMEEMETALNEIKWLQNYSRELRDQKRET